MKRLLTQNYWQKLLAFLMAFFIWLMAPAPNKQGLTEMQFFAPISYINLPKDLEITKHPPQAVSVFVRIPQNMVGEINPSQFQLQVDLSDAEPGENSFQLKRSEVLAPKQVKVVKILPSSLDITFDDRIEMVLPIEPVFQGDPAEGYVMERVTLNPREVTVHGPRSLLKGMIQLETKGIDINGLNSQVDMVVHPIFPQGISPVEPKPEIYTARIEIGSEPMSLIFEKVPIGLVNQVYVTKVNPKSFNVQLRGPRRLMERLTMDDVQAFINLQPYAPGNYKIKAPTMRVPNGVQVLKIWPPIDVWVLKQKNFEE